MNRKKKKQLSRQRELICHADKSNINRHDWATQVIKWEENVRRFFPVGCSSWQLYVLCVCPLRNAYNKMRQHYLKF
jgi:hypothetical protein